MYSALILDDEPLVRKTIEDLIKLTCKIITKVKSTGSIDEAARILLHEKVDIVFLDIEMPEMNGIDFLNAIPNKNFETIIVTAYENYGIKAIKAGAIDYIMKPIISSELAEAVKKATAKTDLKPPPPKLIGESNGMHKEYKFQVKLDGEIKIISEEDVIFFEAINNYTRVYCLNKCIYSLPYNLKKIEAEVSCEKFYRTHRAYLVNIEKVKNAKVISIVFFC